MFPTSKMVISERLRMQISSFAMKQKHLLMQNIYGGTALSRTTQQDI